jgi:hypothetical protein
MVSVRLGVGQGILDVWLLKKGSRVCGALVVDADGSVISYWAPLTSASSAVGEFPRGGAKLR